MPGCPSAVVAQHHNSVLVWYAVAAHPGETEVMPVNGHVVDIVQHAVRGAGRGVDCVCFSVYVYVCTQIYTHQYMHTHRRTNGCTHTNICTIIHIPPIHPTQDGWWCCVETTQPDGTTTTSSMPLDTARLLIMDCLQHGDVQGAVAALEVQESVLGT